MTERELLNKHGIYTYSYEKCNLDYLFSMNSDKDVNLRSDEWAYQIAGGRPFSVFTHISGQNRCLILTIIFNDYKSKVAYNDYGVDLTNL